MPAGRWLSLPPKPGSATSSIGNALVWGRPGAADGLNGRRRSYERPNPTHPPSRHAASCHGSSMTSPRTLAAYSPKRNSLNALRLLLALTVVASHSFTLGGFGPEPHVGPYSLGTISVCAFFAISGYLITASRQRTSAGRFLWHRALRILPGYWVALMLTAFVAAPLAAVRVGVPFSLNAAASYVLCNSLLAQVVPSVGETLPYTPLPHQWNGSLWTLLFEAICYAALTAAATLGLLRRRAAFFAAFLLVCFVESAGVLTGLYLGTVPLFATLQFGVFFGAGALLRLYADVVLDMPSMAGAAAVVTAAGLSLSERPAVLIALPLAYLCLWLGEHLPFGGLFTRNDVSYGAYIYAFPVQQLLAAYGWHTHGFYVYMVTAVVLLLAFAYASWRLIEAPALAMKNARWPKWGRAAMPSPIVRAEHLPT